MLRGPLFAAALFALTLTAWQLLVGSQQIENPGDLAWFGAAAFQILAPLQLAVAMPFSALLVASAVALEKDRKTLDLLLMTNLSNSELVLGKLLAGMLSVRGGRRGGAGRLLAIISLLGGVSAGQILRVQAVTLASALAAGSLGSTIALWREKTFQALAMTALVLVLWLVAGKSSRRRRAGQAGGACPPRSWAIDVESLASHSGGRAPAIRQRRGHEPCLADPVDLFLVAFVVISHAVERRGDCPGPGVEPAARDTDSRRTRASRPVT